jgi:hypothetical protein
MLCEERVSVQLGKHPFRSRIHCILSLLLPFAWVTGISTIFWMANLTTRIPSSCCVGRLVVELPSPGLRHDEERRGRTVYDDDRAESGHPDHRGWIGWRWDAGKDKGMVLRQMEIRRGTDMWSTRGGKTHKGGQEERGKVRRRMDGYYVFAILDERDE